MANESATADLGGGEQPVATTKWAVSFIGASNNGHLVSRPMST